MTNDDDDDDKMEQEPQLRRSIVARRPSKRYFSDAKVNFTDEMEPQSFTEAIETTNKKKWLKCIQEEMQSLKENHTYDLVKLPNGNRELKNNGSSNSCLNRTTRTLGTKHEL